MEAGPRDSKRKVGIIIQARMASERLPGKVLLPMPLWDGPPLVARIASQAVQSDLGGAVVVVATSTAETDNAVSSYCESHSIKCFRGSERNVLSRFVEVIKHYALDDVVRLTGDNPILDITILDQLIAFHWEKEATYSRTEGLPLGMNFEVVSASHLVRLYESGEYSDADAEHVTVSLRDDANVFSVPDKRGVSSLRLTVDYPGDYLLLSTITDWMDQNGIFGLEAVEHLWQSNPWLFQANQSQYQKRVYRSEKEEIDAAVSLLARNEMLSAAKILSRVL